MGVSFWSKHLFYRALAAPFLALKAAYNARPYAMLISDPNDTLAIILAIGDGKSLEPLTTRRAAAAIPFGGSYRIIDFALTNCLHSGLRRIAVLTQYNSLSLHNHMRDGWSIFNTDLGEFVTVVTPPISDELSTYRGVTHALYKNLYLFDGATEETVLIASGEQIYRMDYAALRSFHAARSADVTVVGVPTTYTNGAHFRAAMTLDGEDITAIFSDLTTVPETGDLLWPMGVYVVNRSKLIELLSMADGVNGGDKTFAEFIGDHLDIAGKVACYRFGGSSGRVSQDRYWRTLDDLDAYYCANMDLLELEPLLDLYQADWPIRTYQTQRPPARTVPGRSANEGICVNSIVSGGTVIAGGGVNHSVLGNRIFIDDGATVEDSILFADVNVGEGVRLRRCICDRNVEIPSGESVGFDAEEDARRFPMTAQGVIVIPSDFEFD